MDWTGRRVVVFGLGASGRAAARLAVHAGAEVHGVDRRTDVEPLSGVTLHLGPDHPVDRFETAHTVVVSPGIRPDLPILARARAAGAQVVGELGFAAGFVTVPCVGITGTNGKSTVTEFTGQLLAAAGRRPFVGGNLGRPLSLLPLEQPDAELAVVEVSSYQLELRGAFEPRLGVILNLTPDHLARHGTMAAYAAAKARLFEAMGPTDLALQPLDHPLLGPATATTAAQRVHLGGRPGVVREVERALVDLPATGLGGPIECTLDLSNVPVAGDHNRTNAAVAAALALAAGADRAGVQRGLSTLRALPHRMQIVPTTDGRLWVDDSKATNVEAAAVGIAGLERAAVVLLGGEAKVLADGTLGFGALVPALARHRAVLTFGASGPAIAAELEAAGQPVTAHATLEQAVHHARQLARAGSADAPGEAVLLSPGCASFDAFRDFTHRGQVFQALARGDA